MDLERKIENLLELVTKEWTPADWEGESKENLRYHIREWIGTGGDVSDLSLAQSAFEIYMGW